MLPKINELNKNYAADIFLKYCEVDAVGHILTFKKGCIIHMYPVCDTLDEDGDLTGYADAFICDVNIYDPSEKTVVKLVNKDLAGFKDLDVNVRIFKDFSTCITVSGAVKIYLFQALEIVPIGYY